MSRAGWCDPGEPFERDCGFDKTQVLDSRRYQSIGCNHHRSHGSLGRATPTVIIQDNLPVEHRRPSARLAPHQIRRQMTDVVDSKQLGAGPS
ncbi:MAG: hypothetical protein ACXW1Y_02520, partial [Acidimicrobiia bacterium]